MIQLKFSIFKCNEGNRMPGTGYPAVDGVRLVHKLLWIYKELRMHELQIHDELWIHDKHRGAPELWVLRYARSLQLKFSTRSSSIRTLKYLAAEL